MIKDILYDKHIVAIVGQPHVGKTITAYYLGMELYKEKSLDSLFVIKLIDAIDDIPDIENSIFIFDDLYGDIDYESIGRRTKIITTLIKKNYVIITSRDYIFRSAQADSDILQYIPINIPQIIQEGSYSTNDLELILYKHLAWKEKGDLLSQNVKTLIDRYKGYIVNELRFPHNLELLASMIDNDTKTKNQLRLIVEKSKKIESLVINWVQNQKENYKTILLIISLFRIVPIEEVIDIAALLSYSFSFDQVVSIVEYNDRIFSLAGNVITFKHPSFKVALFNYFQENHRLDSINDIVVNIMISSTYSSSTKLQLKPIFYEAIRKTNIDNIVSLVRARINDKKIQAIIWAEVILTNYSLFLYEYFNLMKEAGDFKSILNSSVMRAKEHLRKSEIYSFVLYLFKRRDEGYGRGIIDQIIFHYSFSIREKVESLILMLHENKSRDLYLIIDLYSCLSFISPEYSFIELKRIGNNKYSEIRKKVYKAISTFSIHYLIHKADVIREMITFEENIPNKHYLEKILERINRASLLENESS